jgi:hypothetical protein
MKKIAILGTSGDELTVVKDLLERGLGVHLAPHESDANGGEYFLGTRCDCTFHLQRNFVEDHGAKTESRFPDIDVLLYLTGDLDLIDKVLLQISAIGGAPKLLHARTYQPRSEHGKPA